MSAASTRTSRTWSAIRHVLHSFRFRLTLLFVAILALILAGFSAFIYTYQARTLYAETANRLAAQSVQLTAYYNTQLHSYDEEREGRPLLLPQGNLPLLSNQSVLGLIGLDDTVVMQQGGLQPELLAALIHTWRESNAPMGPLSFTSPGQGSRGNPKGQEYLFQVTPLQFDEKVVGHILLASPIDPGNQLQRLAISLTLISVLILLLAFGGGYWLADRAMKPVQAIVHTARRISESDLSQRLNLHREDELGELADTFDQMLNRLQAAFERQRQFTADASHELRSPLAIIELEANRALERHRSPEEYEKVLRLIQSENEWMSHLVNDLLLLARMDSGQTAMHAERLDLSELVVEVTERLFPLAQARGVVLMTGTLAECYVQAERIYLVQLLTNLVENAIKYSQGADAQVTVESSNQVLDDRGWSIVQISDNGPGISAEHLPNIFDRFYRTDKARTRRVDAEDEEISGSGLGLAIAKSVAEAYSGKIDVHSRIGKGTTFTVWLPAA